MSWKKCAVVDEHLRFVARTLDGEAMSDRRLSFDESLQRYGLSRTRLEIGLKLSCVLFRFNGNVGLQRDRQIRFC